MPGIGCGELGKYFAIFLDTLYICAGCSGNIVLHLIYYIWYIYVSTKYLPNINDIFTAVLFIIMLIRKVNLGVWEAEHFVDVKPILRETLQNCQSNNLSGDQHSATGCLQNIAQTQVLKFSPAQFKHKKK